MEDLNNTIKQHNPIDIEHSTHKGTDIGFDIDHLLDHKTSLNPWKRTQVIHSLFSDHNEIKLEINNSMINGKYPNIWILNNALLNTTRVKNKSGRKLGSLLN